MSDKKSNPLFALTTAFLTMGGKTIEIGVGATKGLLALLGAGTAYSYLKDNKDVENITKFPNVVLDFFKRILEIIVHFPDGILNFFKIVINNIKTFFNVFIILIVLGHFDWLLEDMYSILGISLVITYATYR